MSLHRTKSVFLLVFIMYVVRCGLLAVSPMLEFADLSSRDSRLLSLQNQSVQVRGFWYPLSPHEGFLAPQTNLKSCCWNAPAQIHRQVKVRGQLASLSPQRAVTLQGIFKIEPLYNSQGQLVQYYILEQAEEVPQTTSYVWAWTLGSLSFLLMLLFICKPSFHQIKSFFHPRKLKL